MSRTLGLDIGKDALCATLVRTSMRKLELAGYYEIPLPPSDDPDARVALLGDAVRTLIRSLPQPPDRVTVSFPGDEVSLRTVTLPKAFAKRIAEVLPGELELVLPFDLENALIDYQVVRETDAGVTVLAAAVPRDRVASFLGELVRAGVEPREVAVGPAALDALALLVPTLATGGPHVIADIGPERTDICILKDGNCELARTLSAGIKHVTSGALLIQIHQTFAAYRAAGGDAPVSVALAGDGGADAAAAAWFTAKLGVPSEPVALPPGTLSDPASLPRYARSAALAARSAARTKKLDLRQGEFAAKRTMGAMMEHGRLIGVGSFVVLMSFLFSIFTRWSVLNDQREVLEAELARVTDRAFGEEVRSPQRAAELLANGTRSTNPLPKFDALRVLDALSGAIPPEIVHDTRRLRIDLDEDGQRGTFELQGTVASVTESDRIAELLAAHECFHEVEKGQINSGSDGRRNYSIEVAVRCPGVPAPATNRRRPSGAH